MDKIDIDGNTVHVSFLIFSSALKCKVHLFVQCGVALARGPATDGERSGGRSENLGTRLHPVVSGRPLNGHPLG